MVRSFKISSLILLAISLGAWQFPVGFWFAPATGGSGSSGGSGGWTPPGSSGAVSVPSGTTTLACGGTYNFTSINIAAGATLKVGTCASAQWTYITASGNVTIDGTLDVSGIEPNAAAAVTGTAPNGDALSYTLVRAPGESTSFSGSAAGYGAGGINGGQDCGPVECYDNASSTQGGTGCSVCDYIGSSYAGQGATGYDAPGGSASNGGAGGGGGAPGRHGGLVWLAVQGTLSGSGSILANGNDGGPGGSGGYDFTSNACEDGGCGNVNAGHSGGSGSGGAGGNLKIIYHGGYTFSGTTSAAGGSGAGGGASGSITHTAY